MHFPRCAATIALGILASAPLARAQPVTADLFRELHWRSVGPFRGGRSRAATGIPTQPNVLYMAQVNGGVWKTDDFGRTWEPIFDGEPTQSIGAIAIAPSNPSILYAASGEGLRRPDLSVGNGIYRSADSGATWTHLGLRDAQQIPALAVDPRNPDRLFAAALGHPYGPNPERGIFRSEDGGAHWDKVLFIDDKTGGSDVFLDPSNPDVVYAALWESRLQPWEFDNDEDGTHGGLFKSADGGRTWRKLAGGLPAAIIQVNAAIAPSNPRRIYAAVASGEKVEIYRSDDSGESWRAATADSRPALRIGGGDLPVLRVDPKDPDRVYSASIVVWNSSDGAKTWQALKGAPGGDDYQNVWINPLDPRIILIPGDQGAVVTVNGGRTWSSWYNQPTAQLYHVSADNGFPYRLYSGQQESGSVGISSRGNDGQVTDREWHPVGAIEYGYVVADPRDSNLVFGAGRGQVSRFHRDTGQVDLISPGPVGKKPLRADRTQPILFSPVDPRVLFYAANILFRSGNRGESWRPISPDLTRPAKEARGTIYAVAPSPLYIGTIWAGTDDGLVWITRDAGRHWADVTPPGVVPWSKVTQIDASHFDADAAYVSVSGFRIDDLAPHIYRTRDRGKTWAAITSGLPQDSPVDVVRGDPVRKGLLYAGTETAVWFSFDDGDHWQSLQLNLPHTSMRDLCLHGDDLIVATHGRGFWILDDVSVLRQIGGRGGEARARLFAPADAIRVRGSTNTDTPLPPDEPAGENPPQGAIIEFWLADPVSGPVSLEIRDDAGKIVRRFNSNDAPEIAPEDYAKLTIPPYWMSPSKVLPGGPGLHRWIWDLRYPAPDSLEHHVPIAAVPHRTERTPRGPWALPGQYEVRLVADGKTYTAALSVAMDPRVRTGERDLWVKFGVQTRLASLIERSTAAVRQGRSMLKEIGERKAGTGAAQLADLEKRLQAQLKRPDGEGGSENEATPAALYEEAAKLYDRLDQSDAGPTRAQSAAAAKLGKECDEVMEGWGRLLAELKRNGIEPRPMSAEPRAQPPDDVEVE